MAHEPQGAVRSRARGARYPRQWSGKRRRHYQRRGAVARVNDKWDEREPDKGHKLVDYAGRCLNIPDDPPKATEMSALALSRVITMSAIGT